MEVTTTKKKFVSASTNVLLLDLFGKAVETTNNIGYSVLNKRAAKSGYLVHPNLSNKGVYDWINAKPVNYNSTFYKEWKDVIDGKFDLWEEACKHYTSTYGTNFEGKPYVVNDGADQPDFSSLKVIVPITEKEAAERCIAMLYSGVALAEATINAIFTILDELSLNENGDGAINYVDIDKVRNKEAKLRLYKRLDITPTDPTEMVRYLVFLATNKSLLIKDDATVTAVGASNLNIVKLVNDFGVAELSSVFHRFKPIFLALKKANHKNSHIINALRKLANKNHVAYQFGFFENLLSRPNVDLDELAKRLKTASNFTKVKLLQAINIRNKFLGVSAYGIRNQKLWVNMEPKHNHGVGQYDVMYDVIYTSLVESLSAKACKVSLSDVIDVKLPTSEKSFIGNFPLGTSVDFSDSDNIVGIHWREKEGARDIDLSLVDMKGNKLGWNAGYSNDNNSLIYSGDMTSANPEATELFYASKGFNTSVVKVTLFSGSVGAKFRFFIAKEKIAKMNKNYMVDPNNIVALIDCVTESRDTQVGVISDNRFVLAKFRAGNAHVAKDSPMDKYGDYAMSILDTYLPLRNVLQDAGFQIVNEGADIDLRNLSKDTLIKLLA